MARRPKPKAVAAARSARRQAPTQAQVVRSAPRQVQGRYDAAQYTDENRKHWQFADGLSADMSSQPMIRRILRNRARYEVANNTYADGIVSTLANDCVGTGARLQLLSIVNKVDAAFVEGEYAAWSEACDLPEKLRAMRAARAVDGEGFAMMTQNPMLPTRVQLDLRLIEADQITSPQMLLLAEDNAIDGIRFDDYGNPREYDVLKYHPGSGLGTIMGPYDAVPALAMLHFFVPKRPGQRRGIPELTPALPLFAQLRRWTLSVLAASETASDFAALVYTDNAPEDGAEDAKPFDRIEIERRAMMTLPAGYKMSQLKAEQPVSTYAAFKQEIIGEIARCLSMPYNIAAGNSSNFNYASGRLDHQTYHKQLRVDRARMRAQVLDRIFAAWIREAILIEGYLPQSLRTLTTNWAHTWFWDGSEHVDPMKEAAAQASRLANKTTTLADEWGRQGADWEDKLEQLAREAAKLKSLGLEVEPPPGAGGKPGAPAPSSAPGSDVPDSANPEEEDTADEVEATTMILRDENGKPTGLIRSERTRPAPAPRRRAKAKR